MGIIFSVDRYTYNQNYIHTLQSTPESNKLSVGRKVVTFYSVVEFTVRKKMAALHFTTIPCEPTTANRHIEGRFCFGEIRLCSVLTTLCMLDLKFLELLCALNRVYNLYIHHIIFIFTRGLLGRFLGFWPKGGGGGNKTKR